MNDKNISLYKAYGIAPAAISILFVFMSITISIYTYATGDNRIFYYFNLYEIFPDNCNKFTLNIVGSIYIVYYYISYIIFILFFMGCILSYKKDIAMFYVIVSCGAVFLIPFGFIHDTSKFVIDPISIYANCKRQSNSYLLFMQYPLLLLSSYVIIGNLFWLGRRNWKKN